MTRNRGLSKQFLRTLRITRINTTSKLYQEHESVWIITLYVNTRSYSFLPITRCYNYPRKYRVHFCIYLNVAKSTETFLMNKMCWQCILVVMWRDILICFYYMYHHKVMCRYRASEFVDNSKRSSSHTTRCSRILKNK